MDDLDVLALEIFLILGAFCLGAVLGSRDRKALPPPDAKTNRNFGESL
jgi:hypothetical protein